MTNSPLALFLKEARIRQGLSQSDVAKELGYGTSQYISNWERGIVTPSCKILYKLASLYRVSAEELYESLLAQELARTERELRRKFMDARRRPARLVAIAGAKR